MESHSPSAVPVKQSNTARRPSVLAPIGLALAIALWAGFVGWRSGLFAAARAGKVHPMVLYLNLNTSGRGFHPQKPWHVLVAVNGVPNDRLSAGSTILSFGYLIKAGPNVITLLCKSHGPQSLLIDLTRYVHGKDKLIYKGRLAAKPGKWQPVNIKLIGDPGFKPPFPDVRRVPRMSHQACRRLLTAEVTKICAAAKARDAARLFSLFVFPATVHFPPQFSPSVMAGAALKNCGTVWSCGAQDLRFHVFPRGILAWSASPMPQGGTSSLGHPGIIKLFRKAPEKGQAGTKSAEVARMRTMILLRNGKQWKLTGQLVFFNVAHNNILREKR